jgi:hypothetical protein
MIDWNTLFLLCLLVGFVAIVSFFAGLCIGIKLDKENRKESDD